jgi:hypothetical protein
MTDIDRLQEVLFAQAAIARATNQPELGKSYDIMREEVRRLYDVDLARSGTMGRIAIALFGDQNNVTDEACEKQIVQVLDELTQLKGLYQKASNCFAQPTGHRVAALKDMLVRADAALETMGCGRDAPVRRNIAGLLSKP